MKGTLIGLLTESLDDEHEVDVLSGTIAGARTVDATVLCVAGGALNDTDPRRRARNFVFDLVGPENVSGVVALCGAVATALGTERMAAWLGRFDPLPVTCLGMDVPGRPSVTVENAGGMREVVEHLVSAHHLERIAFVCGPRASQEAEERLDAYRAALAGASVVPDARLELDGDYTRASGSAALRTLLDERRVPVGAVQAVVAANDYMALGVIDELDRRGISVPDEIAVAGFDDVDSAKSSHPPLTTAHQPGHELGREGVQRLLAVARGEQPGTGRLPTELVVRSSCGCVEKRVGLASQASATATGGVETSFVQRRQIILAEMVRAAKGTFGAAGTGWEGRLLDALIAELRRGEPGGLQKQLGQILRKVERAHADASVAQEVISALRLQALPCVVADLTARARLEEALHAARVAATSFTSQSEALRAQVAARRFLRFERRATTALFVNPEALGDVAAEELSPAGIEAGLLAELEPGDTTARVLFGYGPGGRRAGSENVEPRSLPCHPLFERSGRALVMLPVVLGAEPRGVALLSVTSLDGMLFEDLAEFFGSLLGIDRLKRRP